MKDGFLKGRRIGLSVSNSANLAQLGLGQEHVEDDVVEITRHLLASGATVVYGGDLRRSGFTDLLLEVVARHQARGDGSIRFENFLAWPVHAGLDYNYLADTARAFAPMGKLVLLAEDGREMDIGDRQAFNRVDVNEETWGPSLTAMRHVLASRCDARIVAGGATTKFRGVAPGVAEETLLSVEAGKPTFVLGSLGGCALDIGIRCGLASSPLGISTAWPGLEWFDDMGERLNPGLDPEEAAALASPSYGIEMLVLLLKGLQAALAHMAPDASRSVGLRPG